MEDTFLNVFFVVVSLLLSKEHVFRDQDDDGTVDVRYHDHVLPQAGSKLEEPSIATGQPHSSPEGPGDVSDVNQMMPNVRIGMQHEEQMHTAGDQKDFRQTVFSPDDEEKLDVSADKWTSHVSNIGQIPDQTGSSTDQNFSQGDEELSEKPKQGQIDTHHDKQPTFMGQANATNWYLWKTLSLISFIRFLKWIMKLDFKPQQKALSTLKEKRTPTFLNSKVSEMDYKTLTSFYDRCVKVPASESWPICEFVEGFANDLLENVRDRYTNIEDFVGVGSMYEQWTSRKSLVCDLHIPIIPSKPYSFKFELLRDNPASQSALYGRVKMVKETNANICMCMDANQDDDTLCLIHPDKSDNTVENINSPLCLENSPYLSKTHVVKWFRQEIKKAWECISHKYDFELIFRNNQGPGSLKVRFRSGKSISFNITPVVRFQDSHLVSYLPTIRHLTDSQWPVCLTRYENELLQHFTKTLPHNSCHIRCLQILSFLHKHQTGLTGKCGLKSYHLKNALLHLLLVHSPSLWQPEQIGRRLDDVLSFLQQSLKAKILHHALVGNTLVPGDFVFPKEFQEEKPINLFQPLKANEELCIDTEKHMVEMIKNIPVLIYEYGTK